MNVIETGHILGDRYRVENLVGRGRFAFVYVAKDTLEDSIVALKVFRPSTEQRTVVGRRFFRRIKSAQMNLHPVIVPIKDSGKTDEGIPFLVMEYLEGKTLQQKVESEEALPISLSLGIARAMLMGLAAVHEEGYVHRNINPSNVFLSVSGPDASAIRILDFGIAQDLVDYLAIAPSEVGSTSYLAPELLLDTDRAWTAAVDVFAAGMVFFLMLTGRLPFDKEAYVGSGKNTINAYASIFKLAPPSKFAPHVPQESEDVLGKAIAIDQLERYKNARELLDALDSAVANIDILEVEQKQSRPQPNLQSSKEWHAEHDLDDDDDETIQRDAGAVPVQEHMPERISVAVRNYADIFSKDTPPRGDFVLEHYDPTLDLNIEDLESQARDREQAHYDRTKKIALPEADGDEDLTHYDRTKKTTLPEAGGTDLPQYEKTKKTALPNKNVGQAGHSDEEDSRATFPEDRDLIGVLPEGDQVGKKGRDSKSIAIVESLAEEVQQSLSLPLDEETEGSNGFPFDIDTDISTTDRTLDHRVQAAARSLLGIEDASMTPLKVLEQLYKAGADMDSTLVDPRLEELGVEGLDEDDDDDDTTERQRRISKLPIHLKTAPQETVPADALQNRPHNIARTLQLESPVERFEKERHRPQPKRPELPAQTTGLQSPSPNLEGSSRSIQQLSEAHEKPFFDKTNTDDLSVVDVGKQYPDLARSKKLKRTLAIATIVVLCALLSLAFYGYLKLT